MEHTNPLEVPEIADMVASYLEGKDLASCVRVSKTWHNIFLSHRWRAVQAGLSDRRNLQLFLPFGPDRLSVYTHRHLIQDLSLFSAFEGLNEYDYPNMRRFVVNMISTKGPTPDITMDFTKLSPFLVDLKLVNVYTKPEFWEALSEHPHLRTLTLCDMSLIYNTPSLWENVHEPGEPPNGLCQYQEYRPSKKCGV